MCTSDLSNYSASTIDRGMGSSVRSIPPHPSARKGKSCGPMTKLCGTIRSAGRRGGRRSRGSRGRASGAAGATTGTSRCRAASAGAELRVDSGLCNATRRGRGESRRKRRGWLLGRGRRSGAPRAGSVHSTVTGRRRGSYSAGMGIGGGSYRLGGGLLSGWGAGGAPGAGNDGDALQPGKLLFFVAASKPGKLLFWAAKQPPRLL